MPGYRRDRTTVHSSPTNIRLVLGIVLAMLVMSLGNLAAGAQEATPDTTPVSEATREVLGTGLPEVAPGYELVLNRVVIPAGSTVPAHYHAGMQVIAVESGTVHYTVVSGELPHSRGGAEGTLGAGETMEFVAGDWFVEMPGMVHIAENRGVTPAVVLSSSLLPIGVPSSIPAELE